MKRRQGPDAGLIAALTVGGLLAVIGWLWLLDAAQTPVAVPKAAKPAPARKGSPTAANFQRVQMGMTKPQVVAILGDKYTSSMSAESALFTVEVLKWEQGGNRIAVISFNDGKVSGIAQTNLK